MRPSGTKSWARTNFLCSSLRSCPSRATAARLSRSRGVQPMAEESCSLQVMRPSGQKNGPPASDMTRPSAATTHDSEDQRRSTKVWSVSWAGGSASAVGQVEPGCEEFGRPARMEFFTRSALGLLAGSWQNAWSVGPDGAGPQRRLSRLACPRHVGQCRDQSDGELEQASSTRLGPA